MYTHVDESLYPNNIEVETISLNNAIQSVKIKGQNIYRTCIAKYPNFVYMHVNCCSKIAWASHHRLYRLMMKRSMGQQLYSYMPIDYA